LYIKYTASDYFAKRCEIGVINVGNTGIMTVDGQEFELKTAKIPYATD
jgi:5-keto 4-deoxyuronate isomerase